MATAAERLAGLLSDRYRIERELGRGGMATVFLAEDVRHHRRVAIKVLHPELSAVLGPDRFLKEIELTANLQHPHILPLFDSGSADGLLFYVMPFVEGETLRGRLNRERQLPVPDAVRIATDVADALDYAHRHHVVHRDIKPENILLLDGRPLVADFGIALAVEQAGGMRMTQTGISLGTPQYMAPEQAMGDKHVDHRADIYSLGAVVYEMLAGDPPFTGPTAQSIVARVVTEKPRSLTSIRDTVPRYLDDAVFAALQKLPADRPATAREFAHSLAEPKATSPFEFAPAQRNTTPSLIGGIVLTAMLFGLAGYALGYRTHSFGGMRPEPSRLSMLVPNLGGAGMASLHRQLALSPHGDAVAFVTDNPTGGNILMYQRLEAESATSLNIDLVDPVFSADGKQILGTAAPSISATEQNVSVAIRGSGGATLPKGINFQHAEPLSDGQILYSSFGNGKPSRMSADGKTVELALPEGMRFQQSLSGGRAIFVRANGTTSGPASVIELKSGKTTLITNDPIVEMRYGSGYAVYVKNDGSLWAAEFDEKRGRITAAPVQLGSQVSMTGSGIAQFAYGPSGNLAYIPEDPRSLVFVDRDGKLRYATSEKRNFHSPRFSPQGDRIAVDFPSLSGRDVWVLSLNSGTLSRATFERDGHDASWTPDGQYLTFLSVRNSSLGVFRVRPGGGSPRDSLFTMTNLTYAGQWLRNGSSVLAVLTDAAASSTAGIGIVDNSGRGPVRPLVADKSQTGYPSVSPDEKWLAFASDRSGVEEVYVRPLTGSGEDVQISSSGGSEPVWSRDGRFLFYRGISNRGIDMMEATVRTSPSFEVVSRRTLFPASDMVAAAPHANYDISPDGKSFVLVRRAPSTRINVIQNVPARVRSMQSGSTDQQ
jgi:serine/threonine-protein kinase